jgi:hypothetical protein
MGLMKSSPHIWKGSSGKVVISFTIFCANRLLFGKIHRFDKIHEHFCSWLAINYLPHSNVQGKMSSSNSIVQLLYYSSHMLWLQDMMELVFNLPPNILAFCSAFKNFRLLEQFGE